MIGNMGHAHQGQHDEPYHRHWREQRSDAGGAVILEDKERQQHRHTERHDEGREARIDDRQSFDGGNDRNCGGQHGIAEEEGGAYDADPKHDSALVLQHVFDENDEGQDASFAFVVGAHQEDHIFDRDDQDQGPDEQRCDAEHCLAQIHCRIGHDCVQRLAHGVERACPDVSKNDPDACEGQFP